jgi:hypothetical protein
MRLEEAKFMLTHKDICLAVIGVKDREVIKRIIEAGELMGIPPNDHIIVAGDEYVSAMG